jgi:hypothetical protein
LPAGIEPRLGLRRRGELLHEAVDVVVDLVLIVAVVLVKDPLMNVEHGPLLSWKEHPEPAEPNFLTGSPLAPRYRISS